MITFLNKAKKRINWILDKAFVLFGRASFSGDGLVVFGKSISFRNEKRFYDIFKKYCENSEDSSRMWRLHTLCWAAQKALSIDGDFVECGVYRGFFSSVVYDYIEFTKSTKTFWLYDTFKGFSPKYTNSTDFRFGKIFMEIAKSEYGITDHFTFVKARFSSCENVKVIQGVLPDILNAQCPDKISYLHIDLNSPKAEFLTLEYLYPRVVSGGVLIFDDYGWENFKKQQEAVDKFFLNKGENVFELPTGQGLVIKN